MLLMQFDKGVYTVIPTIFTQDNYVDYNSVSKLIQHQINFGIKNIVLLGTTSETPTLSMDEKQKLVDLVWDKFRSEVNIIVGLGGNNTSKVVEEAQLYKNKSNALMLTVPYYNKPSQLGILEHFKTIISTLHDTSILLYNIPSRTGINMSPEVIAELYNTFDNVKAIKEASGSLDQVSKIMSLCDITVLSGDDGLTLPMLSLGARGVVSVAANLAPREIKALVDTFMQGKVEVAAEINKRLYELFKLLFIESNPCPLKYLLYKFKMSPLDNVRLPLVSISSTSMVLLDKYVKTRLDEIKNNNMVTTDI